MLTASLGGSEMMLEEGVELDDAVEETE